MTASAATLSIGTPERALVERAAAGDHEAFEFLVTPRLERSLRTATAILRSESDARDAVQDAFVAAWQELPRLRDQDGFDAWLGRILVNKCRSMLRHRRVVRVREITIDTDGDTGTRGAAVDDRATDLVEADAIRRAFVRLDADSRILIALHHVENRPIDEIALLMGVPEGTVKWRLHAARSALERALRAEWR